MEEKKIMSFLDKLKEKAKKQENYGGETEIVEAKMDALSCKNCGAGRAKNDGLTKCGYCGYAFMTIQFTDGVSIKKEDNSL